MNDLEQHVSGYLAVDWFLAVTVTITLLLNIAVLRDKYIETESYFLVVGRRMITFGFAILTIRWWWLLAEKGDLPLTLFVQMAMLCLTIGSSLQCVVRIKMRWSDPEMHGNRRVWEDRRHSKAEYDFLDRRKSGDRRSCNGN